jgi:hypothetical protein
MDGGELLIGTEVFSYRSSLSPIGVPTGIEDVTEQFGRHCCKNPAAVVEESKSEK